jgi:hypothetical protein
MHSGVCSVSEIFWRGDRLAGGGRINVGCPPGAGQGQREKKVAFVIHDIWCWMERAVDCPSAVPRRVITSRRFGGNPWLPCPQGHCLIATGCAMPPLGLTNDQHV